MVGNLLIVGPLEFCGVRLERLIAKASRPAHILDGIALFYRGVPLGSFGYLRSLAEDLRWNYLYSAVVTN